MLRKRIPLLEGVGQGMKLRFDVEIPDADVEAMVAKALAKLGTVERNRYQWTKNGRREFARSLIMEMFRERVQAAIKKE